jgi:superfamily II DNA helicase RecQ
MIILPTSSGKSILFLLAAAVSWAYITLVMVPLVSLKESLRDWAISYCIPYTY